MKRSLALLAIALLPLAMTACYANRTVTPAPATAPPAIEEDDPRWDCATMGNRSCGEYPNQLAADIASAQVEAPGMTCWGEAWAPAPLGYRILCSPSSPE